MKLQPLPTKRPQQPFEPFILTAKNGDVWKFDVDNRCMRSFDPKENGFGVAFSYLYAASATYRKDTGNEVDYETFCDTILPVSPDCMRRAGEVRREIESFFSAFLEGQGAR